eukprot:1106310-Amphidinium_carterae.1
MLEKAHCAVVCQPTYIAAAQAIAEEVHEHLVRSLHSQQGSAHLSANIQLTIDNALTTYVTGGSLIVHCSFSQCSTVNTIVYGGGKQARVAYQAPSDAVYDPSPHSGHQTLFASVLFAAGLETLDDCVRQLRESVGAVLEQSLLQGTTIAGKHLAEWSHQHGCTATAYVSSMTQEPLRSGTVCDGWLGAAVLGHSVWIVDESNVALMLSHPSPPQYVIRR